MTASSARSQQPMEPPPRHRSVLKRFFLFSAGATSEVLDESPHSEERLVAGLGSLVLMTTLLAFVSMLVMVTVVFDLSAFIAMPLAAAWGGMIYIVDRFLVSVPLNPHKFSDNIATVDPPLHSRVLTFVKTLLGAVPRLALALAGGIIIAEPLLLVAFHSEVQERVRESQNELASRLRAQAQAQYDPLIEDQSQPQTPEAKELQDKQKRAAEIRNNLLPNAEASVDELQAAYELECSGQSVEWRDPTDNVIKKTSPYSGCGPRAAQIDIDLQAAIGTRVTLKTELDGVDDRARDLQDGPAGTDEANREELLTTLFDQKNAALEQAKEQGEKAAGLLMRIEALEALARDPDPFSSGLADDDTPGSPTTGEPADSGSAGAGTAAFMGLTTLGIVVWLTRLFIILLDTMAIFGKLFLSLRRRRPYDAVTAEHEERAVIEATKRHLNNQDELSSLRETLAVTGFRRRGRLRGYKAAEASGLADLRPHLQVTSDGRAHTYAPSQVIDLQGSPEIAKLPHSAATTGPAGQGMTSLHDN